MSLAYRIVGSRAFVRRMQPGAGLVEDEDDAAQFGAELRGEPGPLQLTPGQCRRAPGQLEMGQAEPVEDSEPATEVLRRCAAERERESSRRA